MPSFVNDFGFQIVLGQRSVFSQQLQKPNKRKNYCDLTFYFSWSHHSTGFVMVMWWCIAKVWRSELLLYEKKNRIVMSWFGLLFLIRIYIVSIREFSFVQSTTFLAKSWNNKDAQFQMSANKNKHSITQLPQIFSLSIYAERWWIFARSWVSTSLVICSFDCACCWVFSSMTNSSVNGTQNKIYNGIADYKQ